MEPGARNGNAIQNFSVEPVFYECEHKRHYDGQAGDVGGPAATRELPADTVCDFHDLVDGGIPFLLLVGAGGIFRRHNGAGGTYPSSTRLARTTV